MANAYVIDTSTIISNPDVVKKSRRHGVIIPGVVLKQLDGLKNSKDGNTAYWARKASQAIERQQRKGNLLIESASLCVNALDNKADNEIIGTALWVSRHRDRYTDRKVKNVILVSTDRNMRIVAADCGLKAEDGDDRARKAIMWRNIGLMVFALSMCCLITVLFPSIMKIVAKYMDTTDPGAVVVCIVFLGWVITGIMLVIASCYSGGTDSREHDHDDLDDIITNPNWSSYEGNIWHR